MLTPKDVAIAIVLMKRAPLTGEEALNTANAISAFEKVYAQMTAHKVQAIPTTTAEDTTADDNSGSD